jgi:hypothetical protein
MADKSVLLIAIDSANEQRIIGAGRASGLPPWRDEQFHSSNPAVPLNDRADRFVTVVGVYQATSRPDLAVVEIRDGAHLRKDHIPMMRVLGHVVEIKADYGTTSSARESVPVKPFYEVRVDGRTIGAVDGNIPDIQALGKAAIQLAREYISRLAEETHYKFKE